MRELFHDQLESIFDDLAAICSQVEEAVSSATEALLTGDAEIAERVISADIVIDEARVRVEETAFALLSLQAPVAGDLRVVVAALRMVTELERMGDLSVHVAKIARLRVPNIAVPEEIRPTISRMAEVAEDMVKAVHQVITTRDVNAALEVRKDDEEMDQLRRQSFVELLSDSWSHGVEAAVDVALLGRYYERIADHAVSVASRVVFVVTGEYPQALRA
jgi:phosphate transport system protein